MVEMKEIPQRCGPTEDPCPKHVGQEVTLGWSVVGGDPDRVRVTTGGPTIGSWDSGIEWWASGMLTQQLLLDPDLIFRAIPHGANRALPPGGEQDRVYEIDCDTTACKLGNPDCTTDPDGCFAALESNRDFPGRKWFWVDTGSFTVEVVAEHKKEDGTYEQLCDESRTFRVERTTDDPDRQAVDFYVNPRSELPTGTPVLPADAHKLWHATQDAQRFFPGEDWLVFHQLFVKSFDDWRAYFGYPPVTPYDGASPVPTSDGGYTMADATRPETDGGTFRPNCYHDGTGCAPGPWFTVSGDGASARGDDLVEGQCHSFYDRDGDGQPDLVAPGQMKLADFKDDRSLGCVLNHSHHDLMHLSVQGSFRRLKTTPHDPLFFAYHKWASGVFVPFRPFTRASSTDEPYPGVWGEWQRIQAEGPPGITAVVPMRGLEVARLPGVMVLFWEPVEGLVAGDLAVNGSPATSLVGGGAGPWVFSGFAMPAPPPPGGATPVNVSLQSGAIRDLDGNPFAGLAWEYTVGADSDGDLLPDGRDNCPDLPNPDQRNTDATQNALFGYAHDGHDGLGDELGDACDPDDDGDGIDDAIELASGSDPTDWRDPDPCPFDPAKTDPGPCGCGSVELTDNDGNVTCAFAPPATGCTPPGAAAPSHPGHRAEAAATCDDGDPCTEDTCVVQQCVHAPASGPSGTTCACRRADSAVCAGQAIPRKVTAKRTRACALLERALAVAKPVKARKLGKKAQKSWSAAAKAANGRAGRRTLTDDCRAALRAQLLDGASRASAFVADF